MDEARTRLESVDVGWITTVNGPGQPQSSPVWFLWDGESVHVATRPDAAKVRNIAAHSGVGFHLDGAGPGEVVVTIEGTATVTSRLDDVIADQYAAKYATGMARLAITPGEYFEEFSTAVRIMPSRWRVFRSE